MVLYFVSLNINRYIWEILGYIWGNLGKTWTTIDYQLARQIDRQRQKQIKIDIWPDWKKDS